MLSPLSSKLSGLEDTQLSHIVALLHDVGLRGCSQLFQGLEDKKVLDMKILSTDKSVRLAGVATHLVRSAADMARRNGFARVKAEATSESTFLVIVTYWLLLSVSYRFTRYTLFLVKSKLAPVAVWLMGQKLIKK